MEFKKKLRKITKENNTLLCVGLDIDKEKIPKTLFKKYDDPFFEFNKQIIGATKDFVCGYKINMAFYEVLGLKGIMLLEKTIEHIPQNLVIILDGKRNDIGNSSRMYAKTLFETFKADGVTINPYLGIDGLKPFLDYKNKCSFILCRTSNPSASDFQDLQIDKEPLYQIVAKKIKQWNTNNNCGAVVGATYPQELKVVREILGEDIPILIPGIGKQGGDLQKTVELGTNSNGEMALICSSRNIIYAGNDIHFADDVKNEAQKLKDQINQYR